MKTLIIFMLGMMMGSFAFMPTIASAHPGNTDRYGCHTCRTNCPKWGLSYNEYHCHRAKALPPPLEPVRSSAKGASVPAPDYKTPASVKKIESVPVRKADKTKPNKSWFSWW